MSHSDMGRCREIYCKTVTGKGRLQTKSKHELQPEERVSHILGCWVMNSTVHAEKHGGHVHLTGSYEINVWFAYDENQRTDVAKHKVHFDEKVDIKPHQGAWKRGECDIRVKTVQPPACLRAELEHDGESVRVIVESEYKVEIISEAKVLVQVCGDGGGADGEDDDFDHGDDDGE